MGEPEFPSDDTGEDDTNEDDAGDVELPQEVVDEAERLTRLARAAIDEGERDAYRRRRDELLATRGFTARVREESDGDVLVCRPREWTEDGVVRIDRIEDRSRAVELTLEGADDPEDWGGVDARNRAVADAVREAHGDVHGDTADAFADFMSNHYARPVRDATRAQRREFRDEYFVRNAWPSPSQRDVVETSLELAREVAEEIDAVAETDPGPDQ